MFEVYATTRYQRIEPIGIGEGMNSMVFRAFDPYLQREIAVKEIEKSRFGNDFDAYCNEARLMFAVSDPNIVDIVYVCETNDHIGLALPYFPDGSLQARIKDKPLGLRDLMKISQRILHGVGRIHSKRLLHLDLKPSNVLFNSSGTPLIADFGHSRRLSATGTVTFPAMYRWAMPPEVWQTHVATAQSDIHQLGGLLYRCANGNPLYDLQKSAITTNDELQRRIVKGRFPDSRVFLPHVPKRIRTIIRKALKAEPSERFHSASEFAAVLGRVSIPLDWITTPLGGGAYVWRAARPDSSDLEVELIRSGTSGWETRVWTIGKQKRAKGKSEYWITTADYDQACTHLTEVFGELNR